MRRLGSYAYRVYWVHVRFTLFLRLSLLYRLFCIIRFARTSSPAPLATTCTHVSTLPTSCTREYKRMSKVVVFEPYEEASVGSAVLRNCRKSCSTLVVPGVAYSSTKENACAQSSRLHLFVFLSQQIPSANTSISSNCGCFWCGHLFCKRWWLTSCVFFPSPPSVVFEQIKDLTCQIYQIQMVSMTALFSGKGSDEYTVDTRVCLPDVFFCSFW